MMYDIERIKAAIERVALRDSGRENLSGGYAKATRVRVRGDVVTFDLETGIVEDGGSERETATGCRTTITELERLGVLQGQKMGREMYFINRALFELLTR
jgi:hypothetical protein